MGNELKNIDSYQKFVNLMDDIISLTKEIKKDFNSEFSHEYNFENSLKIKLEQQ